MNRKRPSAPRGFTLVELVITAAIVSIIALAIGVVIVDSQSSWNTMYDRANSDVVTDGYIVRKKFDAVMRNASREKLVLGDAGGSVEVYYYADDSSTVVDRYARFYTADGDLNTQVRPIGPASDTECGDCLRERIGLQFQSDWPVGSNDP